MADSIELDDWEVLHSSDDVLHLSDPIYSDESSNLFEVIKAVSDGKDTIKPDYFVLNSGDQEEVLPDSGNSSSLLGKGEFSDEKDLILELGSGGIGLGSRNYDDGRGFDEKAEDGRREVLKMEMDLDGVDAGCEGLDKDAALMNEIEGREGGTEGNDELGICETVRMQDGSGDSRLEFGVPTADSGDKNADKIDALDEEGKDGNWIHADLGSGKSVRIEDEAEGSRAGHQKSSQDIAFEEAESGRNEQTEGREAGRGDLDTLGSGGSARVEDIMEVSNEDVAPKSLSPFEGEKKVKVWLKLPLDLLKYCVLRARPVWSISVAAAILGIVMLGRKLYRMKRKSKSIPLKLSIDDKKASQIRVHAARLNDAFPVVRRMPIIRSPLPASGVSLWPVVGLM